MTVDIQNSVRQYLQAHREDMVKFLGDLVQMESPTSNAASQGPILDFLKQNFEMMDYAVCIMPGKRFGGYLTAKPLARQKCHPLQLLIGHCDTVWPKDTISTMPFTDQNGKLRGPGIYDMKAGLTQIVFSLKAIRNMDLTPPLTPFVIVNSDEEKGSHESTRTIERMAKIASRAYILEPPLGIDGKLKTARKGLGRFTLTVKGQPAHAGLDPGKGASAILELSHQIQQLFSLNNPAKGISVNVGMVEGGTSANVIAPTSTAVIDVRVLTTEDAEFITHKIMSLKPVNPETEIIVKGSVGRPPMERTERNQKLWNAAKHIGQRIGLDLKEGTAGGGSDGNTTSLYTATLDGLGTTGDGAHAHHEHILADQLPERTELLTHLLLMDEL